MGSKITSIRVDEEQWRQLKDNNVNISALMRDLIERYLAADADEGVADSIKEAAISRKRDQAMELQEEAERLLAEVEELEEMKTQEEAKQEVIEEGGEFMQETHNRFNSYTPKQLSSNDRFREWAIDHEWSVLELKDAYLDYRITLQEYS
jgi:post-segregation antitoxin (ccd killing protein)